MANYLPQTVTRRGRQRRVVYTCLFGYSEHFNDLVYERDSSIDFVCFTDMPELRSDFWRIEKSDRGRLDPARAAKQRKILAHHFLADYDASLYIDNTVRLPGYVRVDAAGFVTLTPQLRLQLNVENLFNEDYFINADSNTNISPGFPRAVRIGLTAGF